MPTNIMRFKNIGVACPIGGSFWGMGEMIKDVLTQFEIKADIIRHPDNRLSQYDLLLFVGDCIQFDLFINKLKGFKGKRPLTALWQLDPLPPLILSEDSIKAGLMAAKRFDSFVFSRHIDTKLKRIIRIPQIHARLNLGIHAVFFMRFLRCLQRRYANIFTGINPFLAGRLFRRYAWIKEKWMSGGIDSIFCSSVPRTEFLRRHNIPAHFLPVGYHPYLGKKLSIKKDMDVVFIGSVMHNKRRGKIVKRLKKQLANRAINLQLFVRRTFGSKRTNVLNRAKVSLNINQGHWDIPGMRFLMSMGCGTMVISETMKFPIPYEPGRHFVQADIDKLPETIAFYLENEDQRNKIVTNANVLVRDRLTMRRVLRKLLEACGEN